MQSLNTQRTSLHLPAIGLCLLAFAIALFGFPGSAFATSSSEKYAEADALVQRIDSLQTDLNQANADYATATSEHEAATKAMNDAQARVEAAEKRIAEIQARLADRANTMYKSGPTTFIDVLLGASSFEEFTSSWEMVERITGQDAALVQESKDVRAEAEEARAEYAAQKDKAADEMQKADTARTTIATTQASLQAQVNMITAEAAALAAEEKAQAEAAAHAAEEQARASGATGSGYTGSIQGYSAGASNPSGSGIFSHPCPSASISSTFGPRWGTVHKGVDFAAAEGTPYYAAEAGTVLYATYDGGYNGGAGNWVVIAHGNGLTTTYMHSSAVYVKPGQQVTRGQNIGAVGNTGDSYGAHLHFQVEVNGAAVDPMAYL